MHTALLQRSSPVPCGVGPVLSQFLLVCCVLGSSASLLEDTNDPWSLTQQHKMKSVAFAFTSLTPHHFRLHANPTILDKPVNSSPVTSSS